MLVSGEKGLVGPIYYISLNTGLPESFTNDEGVVVTPHISETGFYYVSVSIINSYQSAQIRIQSFLTKAAFAANPGSPQQNFYYTITNKTIKNGIVNGDITYTSGVFDAFFSESVVQAAGNSETTQALALVQLFNGTSDFEQTVQIDFSAMTLVTIP